MGGAPASPTAPPSPGSSSSCARVPVALAARRSWAAAAARPAGGGCATGRRPASGNGCTSALNWLGDEAARLEPSERGQRERAGQKGASRPGATRFDRGKLARSNHLSSTATASRWRSVSRRHAYDSTQLLPLVDAIPPIIGPRADPAGRGKRPAKLHADKAYDYPHLRRALRARGIAPRIAAGGSTLRAAGPAPMGGGAHAGPGSWAAAAWASATSGGPTCSTGCSTWPAP
jgi:hypothetical protein